MTPIVVVQQNKQYRGTTGVSANNRQLGFRPAYRDRATGRVFHSRFANGMSAPVHILDGLPEELVISRDALGRVTAVHESVESGFVSTADNFYTREQAAAAGR